VNVVIGRILTGLCGGLLMAGFNQWKTLTGWLYWVLIAIGFVVCFGAAFLAERLNARKATAAARAGSGLGSFNKSGASQEIEIAEESVGKAGGPIGSHNHADGDQKIKIG
jgi:hypothetical protein